MNTLEESASREDIARRARQRTSRRVERLDILVALLLLVFLIVGWAKDFAPFKHWLSSDLLTASRWPQAWSGGALR